ncbi:MAG: LysR family transcriptional regulator [Ruthenibacterium lactatiformans]
MAELEEYYGVRLFDRIGRRLYLTEAGRRMWEYAVHICGLFDDLEKGLRGWDEQGVLRVGASITIGPQFLPGYVWTHSARHAPGGCARAHRVRAVGAA